MSGGAVLQALELEAIATRWDSSNSLALPTKAGVDESTPMEVDYIGREKGKKGGKTKSKDQKGKSKGKEKGKMKTDGKAHRRVKGSGKRGQERKVKEKKVARLENPAHATTAKSLGTMRRSAGKE